MNSKAGRTRKHIIVVALLTALTALSFAPQASAKGKAFKVKVMTRNLFLGADLGPALGASNAQEFVEANGAILRELEMTDFPRRAPLLAAEIRNRRPDLVGLQEVALWREGPCDVAPALNNEPVATDVRYDFLDLLLSQVNEGRYSKGQGFSRGAYRPVVVQQEFDFEAPADENDVDNDNAAECPFTPDAELNGRLTMRDVILVRKGGRVKVRDVSSGTFENVLVVRVANAVDVPVTRGWTQLDATAKRGKGRKRARMRFNFVNSHFEAFDDETERPSIRALQAGELLAGPADRRKTVILGDFNSDSPGVQPGDEQAYEVLLGGGFEDRTSDPLSCCVSNLFTSPPSEFDHQVDHVMTNMGSRAPLIRSTVVGREQIGGIYPSDHAGVVSKLKLKRRP